MVYKWYFSCQLGDGLCYRSHLEKGNQKQPLIGWGKKCQLRIQGGERGRGLGGLQSYSVSHSKLLGFCGLIKRCGVVVVRFFLGVQITQSSPKKNNSNCFWLKKKKHDRPQNNVAGRTRKTKFTFKSSTRQRGVREATGPSPRAWKSPCLGFTYTLEVQSTKQSGWSFGWSMDSGFPILPMGKVWSTWTSWV